MPIPSFQKLFLPILEILSDGDALPNKEIYKKISDRFEFTEEEMNVMVSNMPKYKNRIGWALTHLRHAGLVDNPQRGIQQITDKGKEVLSKGYNSIDLNFLDQYPGHYEFRYGIKGQNEGEQKEDGGNEMELTPSEQMEKAWLQIRNDLQEEVLQQILGKSPDFFEHLVIDVLVALGYGGNKENAAQKIGKVADEGVDGIIREDPLGLEVIYVQAKRWTNPVGRQEIQKFAGALQGQRARKGIFITTSSFSSGAEDYVNGIDPRIVLIDGPYLARLMIENNIGVSVTGNYPLKSIDTDYFLEE